MALHSPFGHEGPFQLWQRAAQLERLASFMSRPDGRIHVMERAAECRAQAALIEAPITPQQSTLSSGQQTEGEVKWT